MCRGFFEPSFFGSISFFCHAFLGMCVCVGGFWALAWLVLWVVGRGGVTRQEKIESRIHVFSNEKYEAVFNVRGFNGPLSKISCTSCHTDSYWIRATYTHSCTWRYGVHHFIETFSSIFKPKQWIGYSIWSLFGHFFHGCPHASNPSPLRIPKSLPSAIAVVYGLFFRQVLLLLLHSRITMWQQQHSEYCLFASSCFPHKCGISCLPFLLAAMDPFAPRASSKVLERSIFFLIPGRSMTWLIRLFILSRSSLRFCVVWESDRFPII